MAKPICIFSVRDDFLTFNETPAWQMIMKSAYPPRPLGASLPPDPNSLWPQMTDNYIVFAFPATEDQVEPVSVQVLNADQADMIDLEELKERVKKALLL